MNTHLLDKARNILVTITLRSGTAPFVGKIIEADNLFAVVVVKVREAGGELASSREQYESAGSGWRQDRLLVNINDISTIL